MKRKTLIVLLVLLLVGILAFTVFACNDKKPPNNPGTDTPGGDGPGPDDENPPEDETYAIMEALPKLVTGLDKVAATVADIDSGKAAYLGADIGLVLGVTAEDVKAIDLDLGLSLKVSVDEDTSANNWALIGLKSDSKEVAQLFIHAEAANKEVIYIKEALTGSDNWKRLSVLDTSASKDLTGLFTTPGGADPDSTYNDEGVEGFDKETGYHYVYSGGLIGRLFGLIDVMTNGPFAKPITEKVDGKDIVVGYEPEGGAPVIDFTAATPISGIEFMEGLSLNTILGLVNTLGLGELLDGVLHAEAYDNGSGYTAELNRTGIGALLTKLGPTIEQFAPDLDLYGMLRGLNPILSMVLGMSVKEEENTFDIDDKANPKLTIDFNINDDAALENLSINFNNPDIEGLGIELGVAIKNIEIAGEAKEPTEVSGYEKLGLNLALEAQLPAWTEAATIAVSVDPDATIGWDKNGKIQIDLSNIKGYATFNGETIAEYKTHNNEKGFAIDLGPVYDFIAPLETGVSATDLRDKVYFINCDLDAIINGTKAEGGSQLSNAAYTDGTGETTTPTLTGTLGKLITAINAGVKLTNIGDVIGPILTDNNNLVGMLLDLLGTNGAIGLVPALGNKPDGDIKVTVDADKLVDFAMGDNLLGGIQSLINITLYDVAAAQEAIDPALSDKEADVNKKQPITLTQIFEDGDLIEVIIDLVYTAMYDNYAKTNPDVTFAQYVQGGDIIYNRDAIAQIADHLGFDLSGGTDEKFDAADLGNIVATITYGDSLSAKLEVLGAYIQIGADLDTYKAPTASIDTADVPAMGEYIDGKLVVAFNGSDLEKALLELAGYALMGQKDLFLQTSDGE